MTSNRVVAALIVSCIGFIGMLLTPDSEWYWSIWLFTSFAIFAFGFITAVILDKPNDVSTAVVTWVEALYTYLMLNLRPNSSYAKCIVKYFKTYKVSFHMIYNHIYKYQERN